MNDENSGSSESGDKGEKKERKLSQAFAERYRKRLGVLKKAHAYSEKDNIPMAVKCYSEYLGTLSFYHEVPEPQLSPKHFNPEKEAAELLLISQVYWGLAKAYDRNQNLHPECKRCLDQFVKFSVGFRYQYINSEMVRKFVRKNIAYQPKVFNEVYGKIQVDSKKCYVATMCYGESHPKTESLRVFKFRYQKFPLFHSLFRLYYRFSPPLVEWAESNQTRAKIVTPIIKAAIYIAHPTLTLIGRCHEYFAKTDH